MFRLLYRTCTWPRILAIYLWIALLATLFTAPLAPLRGEDPGVRGLRPGKHVSAASNANAAEPTKNSRPNIVYLLCDDLGVGDLKAFNSQSKIATPHLDQLAASGMCFSDAHSGSAVCTPTRYGIMCGRYAWRTRLQSGVLGGLSPSLISSQQLTVPELLKPLGYHSACIGKWHLGLDWKVVAGKDVSVNSIETPEQNHNVEYDQPFAGGPLDVGFDEYFGISASLDMVPYAYLKNRTVSASPNVEKSFGMRSADDKNHTRLGPGTEDFTAEDVLPRLTREAVDYLQRRSTSAAQEPFFLYVPFASPHTPVAPGQAWLGKSGLNPYADFVMQQDDCIGQILSALERLELSENTVVFLASDNGCSPQADLPSLKSKGHDPCRPYRGHKADIYEGGHRVPLIVRWPGIVPHGSQVTSTVCLVDLMATVADITSTHLPPDAAPDSFSILPLLKDPSAVPVRPSTVHHSINGSFAIRRGDYKLCFCPDSGGWSDPRPGRKFIGTPGMQLFDLRSDIGETKNIASDLPDLVLELSREMEAIIQRGRSTDGPDLRNDVPIDLWKHVRRPGKLVMANAAEITSPGQTSIEQVQASRPAHEAVLPSLPGLHLTQPAWQSPIVYRESSVLLQMEPGGPVEARLAFPASEIVSIASADGATRWKVGTDCKLSDDRLILTWVGQSTIEPISSAQMFPPKDSPNSYRHRANNPEQNLFYAPGKWFHQHNIEITYRRAATPSPVTSRQADALARVRAKLDAKSLLKIGVSGDSISTGLDASGTTHTPPNQPGYADLVAAQLTQTYGCEVKLDNRAVGGWSIAQGVKDLPTLLAGKPDLLIVAYGMNDVGRRDPAWFAEQAKSIVDSARAELPEVEIIWVAPMLGNKEWVHTPRDMFALYRDELAKLAGPHAVLADLTAVWETMLAHKHDLDLTGNGLNHPNDFGHRLYAQCILQQLLPAAE